MATGAIHGLQDWAVLAWVCLGMQRKLRVTDPNRRVLLSLLSLGGSGWEHSIPRSRQSRATCLGAGRLQEEAPGRTYPGLPVFFWKERDALWEL